MLPKLQPTIPHNIKRTNLYHQICNCTRCVLHETATQVVYGRGDPRFPLWFVGEAPGREEDEHGLAFVGRSGRLLDLCLSKKKILEFFITNVDKCRPPDNRDPTDEEIRACVPWLLLQLTKYKPRMVVAMGRYSIGYFLGFSYQETRKMTVGKQVGKVQPFLGQDKSIAVMPTYHPAYLNRNPEALRGFLRQIDRANKLCVRLLNQR